MPAPSACSLSCSCLGSLSPDAAALERAGFAPFGGIARELCGADIGQFAAAVESLAESGQPLVVGCTRKEPLFRDLLAQAGLDLAPGFVDSHAQALWSDEAAAAGPKLAALYARAAIEPPPVATVTYESKGVALILGATGPNAEAALDLARLLQGRLDVTVLLQPGAQALPRARDAFALAQGRVRQAEGWLGAFRLQIDAYALPPPAPRADLAFGPPRDGALSQCDLILDLTGAPGLFAEDLRPGYLRDDPRRPGALAELALKAADLVGSFDKARFVSLDASLCAHSRNRIAGCRNCLDLCPTGAIQSGLQTGADAVSIDPMICAGCGQCAAACPSGAIDYQLPPIASLAEQARAMVMAYRQATPPADPTPADPTLADPTLAAPGANRPVFLFHDADHGAPLIEMSARLGRGLPAHVLPFALHEITRLGPDLLAACLAWGADVAVLVSQRPRHDLSALQGALDLLGQVIAPMDHDSARLRLIATDDPDGLETALRARAAGQAGSLSGGGIVQASRFLPPGDKRGLLVAALGEINRLAPQPQAQIPLASGAPFGTVILDTSACTLCMACVSACPAQALVDNPETPMLRFSESACLQCGICAATCPEKALSLQPRLDFTAWDQPRRILHEEEPFACTGCGKGFGTRSGIERVMEKLSGHWMFSGARGETGRMMLTLCEDCRVQRAAEAGFAPHH